LGSHAEVTNLQRQNMPGKSYDSFWRAPLNLVWFAVSIAIMPSAGCKRDAADTAPAPAAVTDSQSSTAGSPKPSREERLHPTVVIDTSEGTIKIKLNGEESPGTVRNFLNYVNSGFYDNTLVHFVDADKMIVAGGYATDRTQKPAEAPIRNEAHNGLKNVRGTIAMARDASRIDSATSQFFFNLADAPQRDHQGDSAVDYGYCVFGEVTEGLDVAEKISRASTTDLGADLVQTPDPPIVIKSIRVTQ
jgi:peptidyl-prolyl cis-trans isomerase A (cyclophilin A)